MKRFGRLSAVFGPSRVCDRPGLAGLCPTSSCGLFDIALHSMAVNSAWPSARSNSFSNLDKKVSLQKTFAFNIVLSPLTSLLRIICQKNVIMLKNSSRDIFNTSTIKWKILISFT